MARAPSKPKNGTQKIETRPDGWERFERAVDAAVKSGPKHRSAPKPKADLKKVKSRRARVAVAKAKPAK